MTRSAGQELASLTAGELVEAALDLTAPASSSAILWLTLIRFELFCREQGWLLDEGRAPWR